MSKLPPQLRIAAIGLIASLVPVLPALATVNPTIAGVQLKDADGGHTTFQSTAPVNVGAASGPAFELQPSTTSKSATVGVNIPSLNYGNLTSQFGAFDAFTFFYQVPGAGPPADAGLHYYLQTSDGFLHIASGTSNLSGGKPVNGVNIYMGTVQASQFSPPITTQHPNTLSIRYANSAAGTIYFCTGGCVFTGNGGSFPELNTGAVNTKNDTTFNN